VISDGAALTHGERLDTDIVVVGAGPAGITTALEASRWGMRVVVLESGARDFDPAVQELSEAAHSDPNVHAPLRIATRRQLGGTSAIWGGRCVPYDPIDFTARDIAPGSSWPISYEQLLPYYGRACDWLLCGRPVFDARLVPTLDRPVVPGFVDGEVKATDLERWSLPTDFGKSYRKRLASDAGVRLFTNVTATEIVSDAGGTATHVCARTRDGKTVAVAARAVVVAAGGLESTRLLMDSRSGTSDGPLGGESGHLGRWYMAHLEGVIALAEFSGPPRETVYGFERDVDGTYIRRRFTFTTEHLLRRIVVHLPHSGLPTRASLRPRSAASLAHRYPHSRNALRTHGAFPQRPARAQRAHASSGDGSLRDTVRDTAGPSLRAPPTGILRVQRAERLPVAVSRRAPAES
jgi:choline dehydrogenase-like flavoprotein